MGIIEGIITTQHPILPFTNITRFLKENYIEKVIFFINPLIYN